MVPAATAIRRARFAALLGSVALVACGGACGGAPARSDRTRAALERYLAQVEPIRLGVNRLLEGADPILSALRLHRSTPDQAAGRMGQLERRFAAYTVAVRAIKPGLPALGTLHARYAHTYLQEDAYLKALTAGVARRNFDALPHTEAVQRAAIIGWRDGLTVLARGANAALPRDLQQAGRGEIAPSPGGS